MVGPGQVRDMRAAKLALGSILLGAMVAGAYGIALVAGAAVSPVAVSAVPSDKQAALNSEYAAAQSAQALPHAKGPLITPLSTCPEDPGTTSFGPFRGGPFPGGQNLVSAGHLVVDGASYQIYTGGSDGDATKGVVILIKDGAEDPCGAMAGTIPTYLRTIPAPAGIRPIHMVAIQGGGVTLADPAGHTLSFDIATATFIGH